ncbi:MAG: hypothetical protein HYV26_09785 [Candidatus Hydrogenedentes bacterium]|nr:hypothetical protein [Candidatus Hydrogenedentota bacterium]
MDTVGRRFCGERKGQMLWGGLLATAAAWSSVVLAGCPVPEEEFQDPQRPFPQHSNYATSTLLPDHRTQASLDADVRAAYNRWKDRYLEDASGRRGPTRYRVKFSRDARAETVSEGQGYGMLIAAYLAGHDPDAQKIFNGLWRFFRDHPSTIDGRLMDWHVPSNERAEPGEDDSAFDGDADIAFALILADTQWGSDGSVDYAAEANRVLDGILASEIGPTSRLPMLGDWVEANGDTHNENTPRSSDFLVAHFRAFADFTGAAVWDEVAAACQAVVEQVQTDFSPDTGLLPDFLVPRGGGGFQPAPADFLEGPADGAWSYNAVRDPWRLGIDAALFGDAMSQAQVARMSAWAETETGGVPANIRAGYTLDGTPLPDSNFFSSIFAAPLGVAAMSTDSQAWLNAVYDAVRETDEGYYEDSVTLLCLLVMTENWWTP